MDELGLDRSLMFPTLASLVEERMKDDPELIHAVIHALNEWMYETWKFDYEDRIFATPVITLPIVEKAIEELEWCLERGAKTVLVRPAPVPGFRGTRSFGLPEFDPFWEACVEAGIPVSMHASDCGYARVPQRLGAGRRVPAVQADRVPDGRDGQAADRGRDGRVGLPRCADPQPRPAHPLDRERRRTGCPPVQAVPEHLQEDAAGVPGGPDPGVQARRLRRPFWEDDFAKMADLLGVDRVLFGSDWPHPEGLAEPTHLIDDLQGLDEEGQRKVMGGNMVDLFKVPNEIVHNPNVPPLVIPA